MHALEDEVSLSFRSQLIEQMKHQHSTGRAKHTLNVLGMVKARNCPAEGKKCVCAVCDPEHYETEKPHFREEGLEVKDNWMFLIRCLESGDAAIGDTVSHYKLKHTHKQTCCTGR